MLFLSESANVHDILLICMSECTFSTSLIRDRADALKGLSIYFVVVK